MNSSRDQQAVDSVSPATIDGSWLEIERISASILAAASEQSWDRVVACAAERHQRLLRHFEIFPVGPTNAVFYQQNLTKMLSGEQILQELAVDARRQLMRESVSTKNNHRAVSAYLS